MIEMVLGGVVGMVFGLAVARGVRSARRHLSKPSHQFGEEKDPYFNREYARPSKRAKLAS